MFVEPLVVHRVGCRGADAALLVFLSGVERAPLRPAVNRVGLDDEPAVGADALAVFLVVDDVAVALRTAQRLVSLFRFLLVCLCSGATPRVCSRSLMAKPPLGN